MLVGATPGQPAQPGSGLDLSLVLAHVLGGKEEGVVLEWRVCCLSVWPEHWARCGV